MNSNHDITIKQHYKAECYDSNGNLKWVDEFDNLVVDTGRNHYLDATLVTGVASPAWYVGLKDTTDAVAGDTIATKGFTELTIYSEASRPAWTAGAIAAGSVDNSASKAEFNINAGGTIGGAFLVNENTKGGTTGILLGAGEFAADRAVISGDIVRVTVTCSITSA